MNGCKRRYDCMDNTIPRKRQWLVSARMDRYSPSTVVLTTPVHYNLLTYSSYTIIGSRECRTGKGVVSTVGFLQYWFVHGDYRRIVLASLGPRFSVTHSGNTWTWSDLLVRVNSSKAAFLLWNLRSVTTGCLASVVVIFRLQFRCWRLPHAELVGSGSWLDFGGRVSGSLLGVSEYPSSSTRVCFSMH